eukprot:COSAG04_NODE_360_length_15920_cov_50.432815_7_plen_78_part_00
MALALSNSGMFSLAQAKSLPSASAKDEGCSRWYGLLLVVASCGPRGSNWVKAASVAPSSASARLEPRMALAVRPGWG